MLNKITNYIKRMPDWAELTFILIVCFEISILKSINSWITGGAFTKVEFTNSRLIYTLLFELLITTICVFFLWLRGYKIWERLKFSPSLKGTFLAAGLFFLSYAAYAILFNFAFLIFGRENLPVAEYIINVQIPIVLAVSLINPLFEETFVLGYVFDKLQSQSVWIILIISVLLRVSYDLYQGWIGIFSVVPIGIIFALAYWRTRNLWSVYLAHALMDLTGLLQR